MNTFGCALGDVCIPMVGVLRGVCAYVWWGVEGVCAYLWWGC